MKLLAELHPFSGEMYKPAEQCYENLLKDKIGRFFYTSFVDALQRYYYLFLEDLLQ